LTNFEKFQIIEPNELHQSIERDFLRRLGYQTFCKYILIAAPPSGQKNSS